MAILVPGCGNTTTNRACMEAFVEREISKAPDLDVITLH